MKNDLKAFARTLVNIGTWGFFNRYRAVRQELRNSRAKYLDLMQACLTGTIYEDLPLAVLGQDHFDPKLREYGWDWPSKAHTMIGVKRLANVRLLAETVISDGTAGDFMET